MVRVLMLVAFALSVNPCAGQGITAAPPAPPPVAPAMPATHAIPAAPAAPVAPIAPVAPATPQISPATHVAAPPPPAAYDDLLKDLPALPRPDSFPPQIAAWVRLRGAGLARFGEIPDANHMPAYVRKAGGGVFANLGDISESDVMALCFLVMMEAAKSAREDLKSIMEKVKNINNAKAHLRRQMGTLKTAAAESAAKGVAPCVIADCGAATRELAHAAGLRGANPGYQLPVSATQTDVGALTELLKKEVDALSERGELESLKLQTAMNRFSKIMSTLTNLLKKRSTTADSIIGNVK